MADFFNEFGDKMKALATGWASYAALGSFLVYLLGYLSLRFHLTTLGVGTDLAVFDERYFFAGASFIFYLLALIPIVLLILLALILLALVLVMIIWIIKRTIVWTIRRWIIKHKSAGRRKVKFRDYLDSIVSRWRERTKPWWYSYNRLSVTGIILSVILIQVVMRQCLFFSNLLVSDCLPPPNWLGNILLDENGGLQSFFFAGMLAGTAVTCALLWGAWTRAKKESTERLLKAQEPIRPLSRLLIALLALLVTIQFLLLPVNHGILADKEFARLADSDGKLLNSKEEAWLIWEGAEWVTYLTCNPEQNEGKRKLITLPRKEAKTIVIVGYEPVLNKFFDTRRCQQ